MSDLSRLFHNQDITRRWSAENDNASARLQLAQRDERMSYLISQHEPLAKMDLDREKLRLLFHYIKHGNMDRLERDLNTTTKDSED